MKILTPLQEGLLRLIAASALNQVFYLTGGTALSAFYLFHRYSEDLDFFTSEPGQVSRVLPVLESFVGNLGLKIEVRRQFATFLELFLHSSQGEVLKCDFAQDAPYRLQPTVLQNDLGIFIDNALDISCNKLSALFDRSALKDFVDVFFIDREMFRFAEVLENARKKHVGMDDYWLAVSLLKIQDLDSLPRMVKPVQVEELREFFLHQARLLMK